MMPVVVAGRAMKSSIDEYKFWLSLSKDSVQVVIGCVLVFTISSYDVLSWQLCVVCMVYALPIMSLELSRKTAASPLAPLVYKPPAFSASPHSSLSTLRNTSTSIHGISGPLLVDLGVDRPIFFLFALLFLLFFTIICSILF
jgi:hypothetical protein